MSTDVETAGRAVKRGPNPIDVYIGGRVKAHRLALGWSQEALAERLGLTFQQVQKYERGVNRVSASRLVHIAEVMQLPISAFLPVAADTEVQKTVEHQEDIARAMAITDGLIASRQEEIEQLREVRATRGLAVVGEQCFLTPP